MEINLVWMRRDLRLHDHAALHLALSSGGKVQPVFVFDTDILARFSNPKDRRLTFLAATLKRLHGELSEQGGGMLILHGKAQDVIPKLADSLSAAHLTLAEDYEPQTRRRDEAVKKALGQTRFCPVSDHVIFPPDKVLKDDGSAYRVFTPYMRRWREHLNQYAFSAYPVALKGQLADFSQICTMAKQTGLMRIDAAQSLDEMLRAIGYERSECHLWPVDDAPARLKRFTEGHMADYHNRRNSMADESGTSRLSPYLRHGLISVRECVRAASEQQGKGAYIWLNEIIWRDFYHQILHHFPDSATQEFIEKYRGIHWEDHPERLEKWKHGKTGFPIVDAAMRELLETGWMHNRARMIVASFMTKDLQLDWRLGEEHFAQYLMDYELSSNVGGWQWAASTGTDAQPYFRIFNPTLQSERFDEQGDYIRRYVPELKEYSAKHIHEPQKYRKQYSKTDYPSPIVDHKAQKAIAIERFKKISG